VTKARDNSSLSGLVLLETKTFSGLTELNFSNIISSTYSHYRVEFNSLFSVGAGALNFRGRINLTDVAGTAYDAPVIAFNRAGVVSNFGVNGTSAARIGTTNTTRTTFLNINFSAVGNYLYFYTNGISPIDDGLIGGGMVTGASPITGFTIFPASGTMTGTASVYGYRK